MEILKDKYSITELSEILHVTDHTLRYYEKEFCLPIPKDNRGRRYYTTELANLMYQITNMRGEGLEIKAIRKILETQNIVPEPPPAASDNQALSLVASDLQANHIRSFFNEFREQITSEISTELLTAREYLSKEIHKSKLELGACMENGMRKLESRMEKHFQDVDKALGMWRERNKKGIFKKIIGK